MKDKITNIVGLIDHTLLKPEATSSQIEQLCQEAISFGFASIFVNPFWVNLCHKFLKNTKVKVGSVVGFPLGASTTKIKIFETESEIKAGANEIDMVMNVGAFKENNYRLIEDEIKTIKKICSKKIILKVIIEAGLLTNSEKKEATLIVRNSGADFVKTNTGLGTGGATFEDVKLIREAVGPDFGVKASGGIRDYQSVLKLIEAGANRIGTSASVMIMQEMLQQEKAL
ncbi:MAG TPA: deoxyribose-phosphate aldolase [candidate division Zixibacteria bacterium]|nr:deoxyribose-phosphate aldolase [candidate division Zixibacteria bacterium]